MMLNIYKPRGLTSHDMVDRVRKITGERKVGHAGTLDPFAEGVLAVAVGREDTKKLQELTRNTDKEYAATLELGKRSTTGDPEGTITPVDNLDSLGFPLLSSVKEVVRGFVGEQEQVPPAYSAVKVKGRPAYKYARKGEAVELKSRKITVKELELLEYSPPLLKLRAVVSSGTYMRKLAEDIGEKLGTGAYLTALTRTRVGEYTIENSIPLNQLPSSNPGQFTGL